jgi:hypothetical protein
LCDNENVRVAPERIIDIAQPVSQHDVNAEDHRLILNSLDSHPNNCLVKIVIRVVVLDVESGDGDIGSLEDSAMTWHYSHIQADEKNSAMLRVYDRVVGALAQVGSCSRVLRVCSWLFRGVWEKLWESSWGWICGVRKPRKRAPGQLLTANAAPNQGTPGYSTEG